MPLILTVVDNSVTNWLVSIVSVIVWKLKMAAVNFEYISSKLIKVCPLIIGSRSWHNDRKFLCCLQLWKFISYG